MTCARDIRGMNSIAKEVTPALAIAASAASLPYGSIVAITTAPFL